MMHPSDLPLEARTHRPVAADYVRHYETQARKVTPWSALRNGDTGFALFSTVVSLVVLTIIAVMA